MRLRRGFTLVELLVTAGLLAVLAAAAIPLVKVAVQRENEIELRRGLRLIREAIDEYKRLADGKQIEFDEDTEGYPPDLETLTQPLEVTERQGGAGSAMGLAGGMLTGGGTAPGGASAGRPGGAQGGGPPSGKKKIVRLLRRIPRDPLTRSANWGLLSTEDDPESDSWNEKNVYDVFSRSRRTALDGTKYRDW